MKTEMSAIYETRGFMKKGIKEVDIHGKEFLKKTLGRVHYIKEVKKKSPAILKREILYLFGE